MDIARDEHLEQMNRDFLAVSDTYTGTLTKDPFPILAELRETEPVMQGDVLAKFHVPSQADYANSGRPVMTVLRYDDVLAILRDAENWKSSLMADGFGAAVDNLLLTAMDDAEHKKYRSLLQPAFLMPVIKRMTDTVIKPNIEVLLEPLRARGKADLVPEFSLPFPVRVVYAVLGFPADSDTVMKLASWALRILGGPQIDPAKAAVTYPAAMDAGQRLFEHVLPIVRARRETPTGHEDLIGFMQTVDVDGKRFTDEEITHLVRMLLLAAAETTSRTFSNMIIMLLERPDVLDKVRSDRKLIPRALTETMRLDPVAGNLARIAAKDMEVRGTVIPKGTAVTLSISAANRDPEAYERPDELWLERPLRPVLSFGFGPHICMGMHIARIEMEAALDMVLDLPNLRFDPAYPQPAIRGLQLRGPDALHVLWDA
ncbi:cytochrome P450 [Sphingobium sp. AR-3-1]|uniref:Cytochrome P450 n=1 Tax=Sphingobium psychrophilum TaxID=2728834 RepID=A0A7X9ZTN4_9SPHN|nr:cytochrome P450 [Sphingobium psychrophilum]NML12203.1 cytochrome P450 [Sphingobium psychrophilum]